jgi:hypothetical protein
MKADIHFTLWELDRKPRWNQTGDIRELSKKCLKIPEGLIEGYAGIGRKLHRSLLWQATMALFRPVLQQYETLNTSKLDRQRTRKRQEPPTVIAIA